jgi:stage V sporulation protein S
MDRFFSKLDLRDIKIDPERSRFSPDDEFETENGAEPATNGNPPELDYVEATTVRESEPQPWVDEALDTGNRATETDTMSPGNTFDESNDVLKVSAKSRPSAVAGAIAGVVRENGRAEVQAIGAGATNQAIKAVAIARDYLKETGIDAVCLPAFIDITIDNEDRTAIRLVVEPR